MPEELAVKMHRCWGCHTSEQQNCPGKLLLTQVYSSIFEVFGVCVFILLYEVEAKAPKSEIQVEDKRNISWKESKKDSV